jgi:hypothetical protein
MYYRGRRIFLPEIYQYVFLRFPAYMCTSVVELYRLQPQHRCLIPVPDGALSTPSAGATVGALDGQSSSS